MESGGASDHQRAAQPARHRTSHRGASTGALAGRSHEVAALWALLFARDDTQSTPEVTAGVVAETFERLLSQWDPNLGPI